MSMSDLIKEEQEILKNMQLLEQQFINKPEALDLVRRNQDTLYSAFRHDPNHVRDTMRGLEARQKLSESAFQTAFSQYRPARPQQPRSEGANPNASSFGASADPSRKLENAIILNNYGSAIWSGAQNGRLGAERYFREAAKLGLPIAMSNLAVLLRANGKLSEALQWDVAAANAGDILAMYQVGVCCQQGVGTARDIDKAAQWYTKAAQRGFTNAQVNLATLLLQNGDPASAAHWYEQAANSGDLEAMYGLGSIYIGIVGNGGPRDQYKGSVLMMRAAEGGCALAYGFAGLAYQHGLGGQQDTAKAIHFFRLAARDGDENAIRHLRQMGLS